MDVRPPAHPLDEVQQDVEPLGPEVGRVGEGVELVQQHDHRLGRGDRGHGLLGRDRQVEPLRQPVAAIHSVTWWTLS